jgi:hypothetical protein
MKFNLFIKVLEIRKHNVSEWFRLPVSPKCGFGALLVLPLAGMGFATMCAAALLM